MPFTVSNFTEELNMFNRFDLLPCGRALNSRFQFHFNYFSKYSRSVTILSDSLCCEGSNLLYPGRFVKPFVVCVFCDGI